ncbi:hypothetical protein ACJJTC_011650 [Scirpophaga incertulas]
MHLFILFVGSGIAVHDLTFVMLECNACVGAVDTNQEVYGWLHAAWVGPGGALAARGAERRLLPDWLRLLLVKCARPPLLALALRSLPAPTLAVFAQTFGVPVPAITRSACPCPPSRECAPAAPLAAAAAAAAAGQVRAAAAAGAGAALAARAHAGRVRADLRRARARHHVSVRPPPHWLRLLLLLLLAKCARPPLLALALRSLPAPTLAVFAQTFGVPVPAITALLTALDACPAGAVARLCVERPYMTQLLRVQRARGARGGQAFAAALQLHPPDLPPGT